MEIRVSLQLHLEVKYQTVETNYLFATDRVIEMHAFLVTLVRQFDFFLPENGQEVKKMRPGMMMPLVVGEEHKGPQMPLKVAILGGK